MQIKNVLAWITATYGATPTDYWNTVDTLTPADMPVWLDMNDMTTEGTWVHTDGSDTSAIVGIMTGEHFVEERNYKESSRCRGR